MDHFQNQQKIKMFDYVTKNSPRDSAYNWDNYTEEDYLNEVSKVGDNVFSMSTPLLELQTVRRLAKKVKNGKILEIGSYIGKAALVMGDVLRQNNNKMYCVDPKLPPAFYKNIFAFGLQDHVQAVSLNSNHALYMFEMCGVEFDMIFIDGDHTYRWVRHDIVNGLKVLKPNGILCGHDYFNFDGDVEEQLLKFDESIRDRMRGDIDRNGGSIKNLHYAVDNVLGKENIVLENSIWIRKNSEEEIIFQDLERDF